MSEVRKYLDFALAFLIVLNGASWHYDDSATRKWRSIVILCVVQSTIVSKNRGGIV